MTIQRQYVLPNCSLTLEALGTDPTSNVLSILANAEFKIVGLDQHLSGGSDFFKAVAAAVSDYCQGLLSGLEHTQHMTSQQSLVTLEADRGQYHRLIFKAQEAEESPDWLEPNGVREFRLSTVQLFDMAEAIDQLVADGQTLPNFDLGLSPLSRRYVSPQQPLGQRLLPPLLGIGSLAIAALGLFMLPVPELADPATDSTSGIETPAEDGGLTPDAAADSPPPEVVPSAIVLSDAELETLQQQLQQQLTSEFEPATLTEAVSYQVSVADNGDVLGYRPVGDTALNEVENTPLPTVTYIPVDGATVEPVAEFRVTFTADGQVEVAQEDGTVLPAAPDSEPEEPEAADENTSSAAPSGPVELSASVDEPIADVDRISALNRQLRQTLIASRDRTGLSVRERFDEALRYRVRLAENGDLVGYTADGTAAAQQAEATPLAQLAQSPDAPQPQLDFMVVFNENGIIEVNPWDGWP